MKRNVSTDDVMPSPAQKRRCLANDKAEALTPEPAFMMQSSMFGKIAYPQYEFASLLQQSHDLMNEMVQQGKKIVVNVQSMQAPGWEGVHAYVPLICVHSNVLKVMLTEVHMTEQAEGKVKMDASQESIEAFMHLMQTGTLPANQYDVLDAGNLWSLANMYDVDWITKCICSNCINLDNLPAALQFACKHQKDRDQVFQSCKRVVGWNLHCSIKDSLAGISFETMNHLISFIQQRWLATHEDKDFLPYVRKMFNWIECWVEANTQPGQESDGALITHAKQLAEMYMVTCTEKKCKLCPSFTRFLLKSKVLPLREILPSYVFAPFKLCVEYKKNPQDGCILSATLQDVLTTDNVQIIGDRIIELVYNGRVPDGHSIDMTWKDNWRELPDMRLDDPQRSLMDRRICGGGTIRVDLVRSVLVLNDEDDDDEDHMDNYDDEDEEDDDEDDEDEEDED